MTAAAIGSGAAGGTLTPSVALGATLGAILGVQRVGPGWGLGDGKDPWEKWEKMGKMGKNPWEFPRCHDEIEKMDGKSIVFCGIFPSKPSHCFGMGWLSSKMWFGGHQQLVWFPRVMRGHGAQVIIQFTIMIGLLWWGPTVCGPSILNTFSNYIELVVVSFVYFLLMMIVLNFL